MNLLKKWNITDKHPGSCWGPGGWQLSQATPGLVSINPTTAQPIGSVQSCAAADLEKLIQVATTTFEDWRQVPAPKRGELVRQIAEALRKQKTELSQLITLEMGKPLSEAEGEVQEMIDMADFAVGQSRMLYGKTMPSERAEHRLFEQWHPLGIVGVITAFNFPMAVWSWNAFLAAICGNVVIWKPSSKTPLCAIAIQQICNVVCKANGYPGIFTLFMSHDEKLGEKFVKDERIALVSFTGSTRTGIKINQWVAARVGRCLLELGGNNALIVDESADIPLALSATLFGAIGTAGQRCTSTRRLLVHEKLYDRFVRQLVKAYGDIKVGEPTQKQHHMGPLIDVQAVAAYSQAIQTSQSQGGSVLFGGHVLPGPGYFVEPTLVAANAQWEIVQQETFAPILYVIKFGDFHEAVRLQNQTAYGLSSALFTNHLPHAEYFLSTLGSDCGIANLNVGTSGAEIGGAFGGEKKTGGGREAGSDAWKTYMRRQTCTINGGSALPLSQGMTFSLV